MPYHGNHAAARASADHQPPPVGEFRPKLRFQRCHDLCNFILVVAILVPLTIFTLSAVLALPLWGLECDIHNRMPLLGTGRSSYSYGDILNEVNGVSYGARPLQDHTGGIFTSCIKSHGRR